MRTRVKLGIALVVLLVVVVGGYVGLRTLWTSVGNTGYEHCDVGEYSLDPDQAVVAAQMVAEVTSYSPALPERAAVLALAAGLQESKLTNVAPGAGDRDSVGVLQQRPSQGWGSIKGQTDTIAARTQRLTDVTEATREFLAALVKIDGWQSLDLADAIQRVQVSIDGSLYAQHEDEAQTLADALQGKVAAGISCSFDAPTAVATPAKVAAQVSAQLPVNPPTAIDHTVSVPGASWQTAAWFVANADRLGIEQVGYAGHIWTRKDGWKADASIPKSLVTATMYTG